MSQWHPLKVNVTHIIDDLLKMYQEEPHEVLVIESIANALDAKATKIKITIEDGVYSVEDNGNGMTEQDFQEKYHSLAFSTKKRGEGIGFAGVGAKLYLIFLDAGNRIITETKSKTFHGASELTLVDGEPKWRKITSDVLKHSGTKYAVELHKKHLSLLVADKVMKIIQKHYNAILLGLTGEITIEVNGIEVPPKKMKGHSDSYSFNTMDAKTKKTVESTCAFYLSKEELEEDATGLEIVVFGKSIKRDWFIGLESIKPEFRKKIAGYVLSDGLAPLLGTNKADFRTVENPRLWANYKQRVYEIFKKWLQEVGAFEKPAEKALKTEMIMVKKDVEEELAKILKDPIISKYNLFMMRRNSSVTVPKKDGDINAVETDGTQKTSGTLGEGNEGHGTNVEGPDPSGHGLKEKPEGNEKGEKVPRNVKHGISIGFMGKKDDPAESWLTPEAILINDLHPTFTRCKELGFTAEKLHLLRCVFMTLIENNPPETMKEAFDDLRTFYKAWSNN